MAGGSLALVTGCPGWLGNRLLHYLRTPHPDWPDDVEQPQYERVRALVLPDAPVERLPERIPDIELVEGDIRDPAAVGRLCAGAEGADVFHLAGIIHPKRIRDLYEINTDATRHVIPPAGAAGGRRVVAPSSNSPAGVARDPSVLFDDSSP